MLLYFCLAQFWSFIVLWLVCVLACTPMCVHTEQRAEQDTQCFPPLLFSSLYHLKSGSLWAGSSLASKLSGCSGAPLLMLGKYAWAARPDFLHERWRFELRSYACIFNVSFWHDGLILNLGGVPILSFLLDSCINFNCWFIGHSFSPPFLCICLSLSVTLSLGI